MNIDTLIKEATLSKNGAAKEAYRAIKSELLINSSSKKPRPEGKEVFIIDNISINELELSIIKKLIKEREESISMYEANSRKELSDIYREQVKYLKKFLPPEISTEKIKEIILELYPTGYNIKEMGKVIKSVKEVYPTADGKLISNIVKEAIS